MSKQYYFSITAKVPKVSHYSKSRIIATSVLEAKNKYRALHPEHKVIACVKECEYTSRRIEGKEISLGTTLLGAAAVAGTALFASFLSKKDK